MTGGRCLSALSSFLGFSIAPEKDANEEPQMTVQWAGVIVLAEEQAVTVQVDRAKAEK